MKLKLCLVGYLCLFFQAEAQPGFSPQVIKTGDVVPDITIKNLLNYPTLTAKISDFRGKLLVLDFWSTWCGSCLNSMPEVAALSRQFGKQIQVISVTNQTIPVIQAFLKKQQEISQLHLTMALEDRKLEKLFPHVYYPHLVWISPQGKFLGSTTQDDLNPEIVQQLLTKGRADFSDYKDDNLKYDESQPLFQNGNGGIPFYLCQSLLTRYQPGLPSSLGTRVDSNGVWVRATNMPLKFLLLQGLNVPRYRFPDNRFIIEAPLKKSLLFPDAVPTKDEYLFCYQLQSAVSSRTQANATLLDELQRCFHFVTNIEKRPTECLILKSTKKSVQFSENDILPGNNLSDHTAVQKYISEKGYSGLVAYLNKQEGGLPVIDETGITKVVSLRFGANDTQTITAFNQHFESYGICLEKTTRNLEMVVLSAPVTAADH